MQPFWPVDPKTGLMRVDDHLKVFSLDVGFNFGAITNDWLSSWEDQFVVGFEASSQVVSMFRMLCDADEVSGVLSNPKH